MLGLNDVVPSRPEPGSADMPTAFALRIAHDDALVPVRAKLFNPARCCADNVRFVAERDETLRAIFGTQERFSLH